jgi:hypothetical protein
MELKKVGVWSVGKIAALFGLLAGIITVIIMVVFKNVLSSMPAEVLANFPIAQTALSLSLKSALLMIVSDCVFGFVWGVIIAFLYNVLAKLVGGVKLDFKK